MPNVIFKPGDPTPIQAGVVEGIVQQAAGAMGQTSIIATNSLGVNGIPNLYPLSCPIGSGFANAFTLNTLYLIPWVCPLTGTLDQMKLNLSISGGAGSLYRFGLYSSTGQPGNPYPNEVLFDSGALDGTVTGVITQSTKIAVFAGSLYFSTYICTVGSPTINASTPASTGFAFGLPANLNATLCGAISTGAIAFGALPNPFPKLGAFAGVTSPPMIVGRYL